MSPTQSARAIFSTGEEFSTSEIAAMTGMPLPTARTAVWRMVTSGELKRIGKTIPCIYRASEFESSTAKLTTVQYALMTQPVSVFQLAEMRA